MAKYVPRHREQALMIPVHLDDQLQPGTFEHALDHIIDHRIDLTVFEGRYRNDETGRPAWDPAVLLKVVLFGYARGLFSSRAIARACEENVVFMALADGARPHFTTVADFVSSMRGEIAAIFQHVLLICSELDLVGGEIFAVDGRKISSNAAKEWSGTRRQLEKKQRKIRAVVDHLLEKHRVGDAEAEPAPAERIERLERKISKIESFLAETEPKMGKRGRELQSNVTDNESARMQTSHGVVQGYNGLAMVDAKRQVIVCAEAFGSGQEHDLLGPMVEGARRNLSAVGRPLPPGAKVIGDTNYHSEENCRRMSEEGLDAYLPDVHFRKRDPRFATAGEHKPKGRERFRPADFAHDAAADRYVCPAGKALTIQNRRKRVAHFVGRSYAAREEDCAACALRDRCLTTETTKRRYLYVVEEKEGRNHSEAMKRKIDTPEGREMYSRRMGIVEPVFAHICFAKGLDRITLRGKAKATIQWMLYAITHNIEKIWRYGGYGGLSCGTA